VTQPPEPLVLAVNGVAPRIAPDVFLAPGAVVVGDVEIGPGSSVWFNAVLRGDIAPIRLGARTNVQDGAVLHLDRDAPCILGDDVTVGHRAIVHGATVGNGVIVGMGSIVLSRARIGDGVIVAAGAVVPEGFEVPAGALVAGVPATVKRIMDEERQRSLLAWASGYVANAARFKESLADVTAEWRRTGLGGDGGGG
jgi:carbonic anhydrase/acetyltransferase-like protein (isoleucine patch superfamily)